MTPEQSKERKSELADGLEVLLPSAIPKGENPAETPSERRHLEEIQGWTSLGIRSEARRVAENFLLQKESLPIRFQAMELAMSEDDLPRAAHHARHIYRHHPWIGEGSLLLSVILGYAGHPRAAYQVALADNRNKSNASSWYNLACKAWGVGRREEAFRAVMKAFSLGTSSHEILRKMTLDSELGGVWSYMATRRATLADVFRWSQVPLERILQITSPAFPPRDVDFADLRDMPPEFRILLRQRTVNTKVVDFARAQANRELFQKYVEWEQVTCLPKVGCLEVWKLRLRSLYDKTLPDMVRFCVARGRPGVARYLLRRFLDRHPQTTPDSLPMIPGLEYFIEEWRRLREIDPEGTIFLINLRPRRKTLDDFKEEFSALPRALRESGLGFMVLGCELWEAQKYQEALDAFRSAISFWPRDEQLHHNIVLCLCTLGRWNEAEKIVAHSDFLAGTPEIAEIARQAVKARHTALAPQNPQAKSLFPTPSFGMPDHKEDTLCLQNILRSRAVSNSIEP